MKRLYFTRHAEQHRRTGGHRSTATSTSLTDLGKWHATAAGTDARTRGLQFDLIMSSPLPHAHHTARIIADELDYNPKHIELSDLLLGYGWTRPHHQPGHIITPTDSLLFAPDNTEAKKNLHARGAKILELLFERPEKSILLVGHSAFGHALQQLLNKDLHTEDYQDGELPHAHILQFI